MKTFIHVGLHKTASTYLQTEVFPRLKSCYYVSRPTTQFNYELSSLQYLDDTLYKEENVIEYFSGLRKKAGGKNLFLSDEAFSGKAIKYGYINRSMIADRLSRICNDAEIIIVLRNPIDILISLYNQYVKIGGTNHYKRYFKKIDKTEFFDEKNYQENWDTSKLPINTVSDSILIEYFNYSKLIELYETRFKKVHVLFLEKFSEENYLASQLERIFSESLEIPSNKKKINQSIPNGSLALYAKLNRLLNVFFDNRAGIRKRLYRFDILGRNDELRKFLEDNFKDLLEYKVDKIEY